MDPITLRAVERILAIAIGGLSILLGYRLFLAIPEQRDGSGTFRLPWNISVGLARVGPGVFFALFGAAVVGYSLHGAVHIVARGPDEHSAVWDVEGTGVVAATSGTQSMLSAQRLNRRGEVEFLNTLDRMLRRDLSDEEKRAVQNYTRDLKLSVMKSLWASDWGDPAAFREWTERGALGPPPKDSQKAAEFFRSGQEERQ
jgi:hypothetical protein